MNTTRLERGMKQLGRLLRSADQDGFDLRVSVPPHRGIAIFVAFVAAFLLWFTVSMRGTYPLTVDLPTQVVNIPNGRALEELPPSSVRVQVQGEGWQLLRLFTNRSPISIDASATSFNVTDAVVMELPRDLEVQSVTPATCDVRLGERIRRKVPILFRGRIEPALTHDTTEAIRLEPDSVVVEGAASVLRSLLTWPTKRLQRQNVRGVFTAEISLADSLAGLVERDVESVTVLANIEQFTEVVREVEVRVTDLPDSGAEVSLNPDRVQVVIRVPLSRAVEAEETDDLWAYVTFGDIASDSLGAVTPRLHGPPGLSLRNQQITPSRLRYYMVVR